MKEKIFLILIIKIIKCTKETDIFEVKSFVNNDCDEKIPHMIYNTKVKKGTKCTKEDYEDIECEKKTFRKKLKGDYKCVDSFFHNDLKETKFARISTFY